MSIRENGRAFKSTAKFAGMTFVIALLAGCSSIGSGTSGLFGQGNGQAAPFITGSTQTANSANLDQSMPNALQNGGSGSGRYVPPINVGGAGQSDTLMTASISPAQQSTLSQNASPSFTSQSLPALPQPTTVGSQQTMSAQTQIAPVQTNQQSLFANQTTPNQVTTVAAAQPAPALTVVPENAFQHTIESGESLYAIARRYDVTTGSIVHANSLSAPDQIFVGQKIFIPGRADLLASNGAQTQTDTTTTASISTAPAAASQTTTPQTAEEAPVQTAAATPAPSSVSSAANFRWPVQGRVIVDFSGSHETGINIEAPEGAAVRAAENGTVIYVGNGVEGYGNLVLVRHGNGFVSAYAHLKDVTISKDDVVQRGDSLGTIGMTGSVSRPQLHFELRQGANPVDPMPLLAS